MAIPGVGLGSDATKIAWVCFQIMTSEYKISEKSTAGVMGNIYAESMFNPDVVEGGNGIGWGLFQLSFGRRTAGEKWCNDHGYSKANMVKKTALQLKYVFEIEQGGFLDGRSVLSHLKSYKTVEEACNGWCYGWERPGIPRMSERLNFANKVYKAWKGKGGQGVKGLEGLTFGGDIDDGPTYISFEEALIEGFKGGKKAKPEGIAIHEITGYSLAKSAKNALQSKKNIGQGGAQFHLVCDKKDAFLVVDLDKRVSHVERTNKNPSKISNPNSKIISIGMCGHDGDTMGKAAQVAAEVCHLLNISPRKVEGSYKYDALADPKSWKDQEFDSGFSEIDEGFMNEGFKRAVQAALDRDIGGIKAASLSGGGGRGSTKKVIEVAEKWHAMNDKCYYSMAAPRVKGPHSGGVDCSGFVLGCIAGAGYNIPIGNTVYMLQNCKPLPGEKNSSQCLGGKNAFFKQIKPSDAQKGDILVAGGLAGAGGAGHTGLIWSSYKGGETKFMNAGGCDAEGGKQPNLSTINCAMGYLGCWVFMTINKNDSDESDYDSNDSKNKKNSNIGVKKS